MAYNKHQWIESFEGQMSLLRPHLGGRVLTTMSLQAWSRFGEHDPVQVAKEAAALLAQPKSAPRRSGP